GASWECAGSPLTLAQWLEGLLITPVFSSSQGQRDELFRRNCFWTRTLRRFVSRCIGSPPMSPRNDEFSEATQSRRRKLARHVSVSQSCTSTTGNPCSAV